ncbi:hypothetical protein [Psychroflexus halocasei]|uniref:Uncharacterized protein n=1 Tax=Psychroflexus halocasei TaxID=908615 RepID=A0A1H4B247_9FLAO|nr:hypothetical protein [Psychroflexus halocasei]SEA42166.1 hypothetical protein SAMN05421540_105234 [Psychroflexus halocasei]
MKKMNFVLLTFVLALMSLSCSSDDDSGNPDPVGSDGNGSFEYNIEGVGSYTSTAEDLAYVVYSTDPEDTEVDGVSGVYIVNGSSSSGNHIMNLTLIEINGEIVTAINSDADDSSGAYISHLDNGMYFSVSGQIEVLHASHGPLNGNNVATAKVKLKLNGQFMDSSFNEESLKSVSASINADTPPLFYPGL